MKKNEVLICGLDAAGIEKLKETEGFLIHGFVKQNIGTPEKPDFIIHRAIFREPDQKIMEAVGAISKTNEARGALAMYNNCMVKADPAIEARDLLKIKAVEAVVKHINSFSVDVKNL